MIKQDQHTQSTAVMNDEKLWKIVKTNYPKFQPTKSQESSPRPTMSQSKQGSSSRVQCFLKKIHDTIQESYSICSESEQSQILQNINFINGQQHKYPPQSPIINREALHSPLNTNGNTSGILKQETNQKEDLLNIKIAQLITQNKLLMNQNQALKIKIEKMSFLNKQLLLNFSEFSKQVKKQQVLGEQKVSILYETKIVEYEREMLQAIKGCNSCLKNLEGFIQSFWHRMKNTPEKVPQKEHSIKKNTNSGQYQASSPIQKYRNQFLGLKTKYSGSNFQGSHQSPQKTQNKLISRKQSPRNKS